MGRRGLMWRTDRAFALRNRKKEFIVHVTRLQRQIERIQETAAEFDQSRALALKALGRRRRRRQLAALTAQFIDGVERELRVEIKRFEEDLETIALGASYARQK